MLDEGHRDDGVEHLGLILHDPGALPRGDRRQVMGDVLVDVPGDGIVTAGSDVVVGASQAGVQLEEARAAVAGVVLEVEVGIARPPQGGADPPRLGDHLLVDAGDDRGGVPDRPGAVLLEQGAPP